MDPREAIEKLQGLKANLSQPLLFYAGKRAEWETLAAKIAYDSLTALCPPHIDPDLWRQAVQTATNSVTVTAHMVEIGVVVTLSEIPFEADESTDPNHFSIRGIRVSDVQRWVQGSMDGTIEKDVSKRLDHRDQNKSSLQIAWRILHALKLNKPGAGGLEAAIKKFLGFEAIQEVEALYPQVLKVWLEFFVPLAFNDFRQWVREVVAVC